MARADGDRIDLTGLTSHLDLAMVGWLRWLVAAVDLNDVGTVDDTEVVLAAAGANRDGVVVDPLRSVHRLTVNVVELVDDEAIEVALVELRISYLDTH